MNSDRDHCSISANTENFKYEAFRLMLNVLLYYSETRLLIQRKALEGCRPFKTFLPYLQSILHSILQCRSMVTF